MLSAVASAGRRTSHQGCPRPGASQSEFTSARSCSSFPTGACCSVTTQQLRHSSWWSFPPALSNRCAGITPCLFFFFFFFFPSLAASMQACALWPSACLLLACDSILASMQFFPCVGLLPIAKCHCLQCFQLGFHLFSCLIDIKLWLPPACLLKTTTSLSCQQMPACCVTTLLFAKSAGHTKHHTLQTHSCF